MFCRLCCWMESLNGPTLKYLKILQGTGTLCQKSPCGPEVVSKVSQVVLKFFKLSQIQPKLSQNCLKVVQKLAQSCPKVVSNLSQMCLKVVPQLSQRYPKVVSKVVPNLLQTYPKLSQNCFKLPQSCLKGIPNLS